MVVAWRLRQLVGRADGPRGEGAARRWPAGDALRWATGKHLAGRLRCANACQRESPRGPSHARIRDLRARARLEHRRHLLAALRGTPAREIPGGVTPCVLLEGARSWHHGAHGSLATTGGRGVSPGIAVKLHADVHSCEVVPVLAGAPDGVLQAPRGRRRHVRRDAEDLRRALGAVLEPHLGERAAELRLEGLGHRLACAAGRGERQ
mmetsp:Transcript_50075/g.160217  ORF Transcript_50075/g.160217 Transcript_50075/m.160217 type:complete len:207 (+) Transcript_50075:1655-2275(+)